MRQNKKQIYFIISLVVMAIGGLFYIQAHWLRDYYATEESKFRHRIHKDIDQIENAVRHNPKMTTIVPQWLMHLDRADSFPMDPNLAQKASDFVCRTLNESMLKDEISEPYDWAVLKIVEDKSSMKLIYSTQEAAVSEADVKSYHQFTDYFYLPENQGFHEFISSNRSVGGYKFAIKFKDNSYYQKHIGSTVQSYIWLSLLFMLVVLGCFIYTLLIINRQAALDAMKNNFINNLTHELKTPIFSISLVTKVFRKSLREQDYQKLPKYLDIIEKENAHLKDHVEKVLQIAQMGNRKQMELEMKSFDLVALTRETLQPFELIASEKSGHVSLSYPKAPQPMVGDPTHVKNIIHNLVDNAIKYSKDIPEVKVNLSSEGDTEVIEVVDSGVGMTAGQKKTAFDMFYRVPTGDVHKVKGFGLGLSYVKLAVQAHQGEVDLSSKLGGGTKVRVSFPKNTAEG
ncbi:HAMP domain-containing sensor histidine kinase [Persicobacter diffluens]|uniref:histidine kinase n=1 Tax=Persicobacter diffluens TaxID=981 RepID=A0AAN5AMM2_9BACT|nr:hypothetical protein PEDI_30830 [Persicobacter diffluens]